MEEGDYSTRDPPFSLLLWRQFYLKRVTYSHKRKGLILICEKPINLRIVVYSLQRIVAINNYYFYCFHFFKFSTDFQNSESQENFLVVKPWRYDDPEWDAP